MSPTTEQQTLLRRLPGVDAVLAEPPLCDRPPALAAEAVRAELEAMRNEILSGDRSALPSTDAIAAAADERVAATTRPKLRRVVNATGVLLHTNLGRAPLADTAVDALRTARAATDVELDLETGRRGIRGRAARELLCELTGAEAALVVNNCAAAVLLAVSSLARGGEVIVSRGELVEIGGSFRVPDVIAQGGATLREVGTTNRTRLSDIERAIRPETAALLKTHASNFRLVGFTEDVGLDAMVDLAREVSATRVSPLYVIEDLGSATIAPLDPAGDVDAPTPTASLDAGADVVCFSGDKLLGGPQAGIILGREGAVARLRRHPLYRALRPGKLTLAALEATLVLHRDPELAGRIPLHRFVRTPVAALERRAEALVAEIRAATTATAMHSTDAEAQDGARERQDPHRDRNWSAEHVEIVPSQATIGGGSLPGEVLESRALALRTDDGPDALARRLRLHRPAVVGRIKSDAVLLDLRTIAPEDDAVLTTAVAGAWQP